MSFEQTNNNFNDRPMRFQRDFGEQQYTPGQQLENPETTLENLKNHLQALREKLKNHIGPNFHRISYTWKAEDEKDDGLLATVVDLTRAIYWTKEEINKLYQMYPILSPHFAEEFKMGLAAQIEEACEL